MHARRHLLVDPASRMPLRDLLQQYADQPSADVDETMTKTVDGSEADQPATGFVARWASFFARRSSHRV